MSSVKMMKYMYMAQGLAYTTLQPADCHHKTKALVNL